jgi:iron complex outermembrane receptor protein
MKRLAFTIAWLGALLAGASALSAQSGTIQARVTDAETGAALPGVQITLEGTGVGARSTTDRTLIIRNVPTGTQTVSARRLGYETVRREIQVRGGETLFLDIALSQKAVAIGGITVTGQHGGYVADRSTTATKMDVPLLETPQSVSVITSDQIRDQAPPNLQEALRYTPGVRNELYGIDNRGDWFALRGSQESTTLLDGLRLPLTGYYGVVRTEPYAYERVEVLRGPASIIAGQNDPGGVVNLVSKRPQPAASREFGVNYGNHDRREIHADLTGPLDEAGAWLYRLVAVGKDGGTQVAHADEQRAFVAPSLTWRSRAGHSVTAFGEYQYDRSKNTNAFLGLEGTLNPAPNGPIPTDLFIGEPDWDRYGGTRWRFGYAADFSLGGSWHLRNQLRHDQVHGLMESMYAAWWLGFLDESGAPLENGRYLGREWYISDDESHLTTGEVLLEGSPRTGGVAHHVLFGVDGLNHRASQVYAEAEGPPLDVYAPVYGVFAEPTLGDAAPSENEIRRVGVLAQDQMKFFDRLSLRLGLRRDYVRNAVVDGETATDWATTGNVGVVYEVLPGLAPYASYSESFNPVSGTNAAGEAFKPKRGEQVEAGVRWEPASLPLEASAAYYTLKEKNRLASDPNNVNQSIQIGEARVRGLELEARSAFARWKLLGGYSYTRARASADPFGTDLDADQQLEGIPEHTASLWAVHDFGSLGVPGLSLGGGARYVGRIGDGTGNVFVPAVTLFDALAAFDRGPWRFALNVNNVADKSYIATCLARGDCWFGQRRTVQGSLAFRW